MKQRITAQVGPFETFNIIYQNIRSIMPKTHLLESLLEGNSGINAICITETWLNTERIKYLHINGYHVASSYSRKSQGGGGVCILLENFIDYTAREDINKLSIESIFEICAVDLNKINVVLIVLYWPNSNRDLETFYNQLEKLLRLLEIKDSKKSIILGGDFNINLYLI